jgi:MoxR-like ATPase
MEETTPMDEHADRTAHEPTLVPPAGAGPRERLEAVLYELRRVVVGQDRLLDRVLVSLLARGHVLLEGVPGLAKTLTLETVARVCGGHFSRIQFTPDLVPSDVVGGQVLDREGRFTTRLGPVFANFVLADEINRAPAKTQSALLEAMQERQVTIEGDRFELPNPFLVLATQNPIDLEGTYPLPEAQIDRFLVRVMMGYPHPREEAQMLKTHGIEAPALRAVLNPHDVVSLQQIAARIHVDDDLHEYAVGLTAYTRTHPKVALGASPRATLGLVQAAKAHALVGGRTYVVPEDLRSVAPSVLAHRLVLVADSEGDARVREAIIEEALSKVGYRRGFRAV